MPKGESGGTLRDCQAGSVGAMEIGTNDMANTPRRIYFSEQDDGTVLAASIDSPRFCVGASTEEEALAKARRAVAYYNDVLGKVSKRAKKETRVIRPLFQERELCA